MCKAIKNVYNLRDTYDTDVNDDTKHRMFMNGLSNTICIKSQHVVFCITLNCYSMTRVNVAEQMKILGHS